MLDFHSGYYIPEIEKWHFIYCIFTLLEKYSAGKGHNMFFSQQNKHNCKCKRDYAERFQVLRK